MLTQRLKVLIGMCALLVIALTSSLSTHAQSTSNFTYQGYLEREGAPVTDVCEFEVALYDDLVGGVQLANTLLSNVPVTDGLFTLQLDFGVPVFDGGNRFLEVSVTCPGYPFTTLSPRQCVTPNPYSIRAYNANSADIAPWSGLTGVPAGFADGIDNGITYARTIIVSPLGTPTENGTALRNALNAITGNSATNPYLIHIEPGIYDVGNSPLVMKDYVHLQGSGVGLTIIRSLSAFNNGTITSDVITEIRFLSIVHQATGNLMGLRAFGGQLSLLHVAIDADSPVTGSVGALVVAMSATLNAEHVTIEASSRSLAFGITTTASTTVTLTHVIVEARTIINNALSIDNNAITTIYDSQFTGTLRNTGTLRFAGSQLNSPVQNTGTIVCVSSHNRNFVALSSTCT